MTADQTHMDRRVWVVLIVLVLMIYGMIMWRKGKWKLVSNSQYVEMISHRSYTIAYGINWWPPKPFRLDTREWDVVVWHDGHITTVPNLDEAARYIFMDGRTSVVRANTNAVFFGGRSGFAPDKYDGF